MEQFLQTFKARPTALFNRGIRLDKHFGDISLTDDYSIQDIVAMSGRARTLASALLSLGRYPYIDEGSSEEEQYILHRYSITIDGNRHDVIGLASAYLQNTVAIGFESEIYWQKYLHSMTIENNEDSNSIVDVISVSSPDHFSSKPLLQWIENHTEIELIESMVPVNEKKIHLRDDHGTDALQSFARRLIGNKYVEGIVNSCEFSPHNRRFIRAVHDNGIIDITLTWTDQGFGIAVQTTGRNRRETEKIAELLQDKFSC